MPETKSITCAHCGQVVAAELIAGRTDGFGPGWLRCPACEEGSIISTGGYVHPIAPPGGAITGAPEDVGEAWREARSAFAAGAFTAAEIMCRKILMHIAVGVAGSKPGKSFVEYVDALEGAGYLTTGLKPVVDKIRARGNTANHELPASTETECITTLAITEHLLRSVYELPGLA